MTRLPRYFIQGLLIVGPLAITVYIVYRMFVFVDGLLHDYLEQVFGWAIPGLGVLIVVLSISLIGFAGQTIVARPIQRVFERMIGRIPILETIYSSLGDFLEAIFGEKKKFNKPVLVRVNPISELEKLGFITDEDLSSIGEHDKVAVYFPHSYNFSGELFIVPRHLVRPLSLPASEVMKFVVSGGVARMGEG
jgi:uncharacterized membrane protein